MLPVDEKERNVSASRVTAGRHTHRVVDSGRELYLFQRQFGLRLFTDFVTDVSKSCSGPQPGLRGCNTGHRHALGTCHTDLCLIFSINLRVPGDPERHGFFCTRQRLSEEESTPGNILDSSLTGFDLFHDY